MDEISAHKVFYIMSDLKFIYKLRKVERTFIENKFGSKAQLVPVKFCPAYVTRRYAQKRDVAVVFSLCKRYTADEEMTTACRLF